MDSGKKASSDSGITVEISREELRRQRYRAYIEWLQANRHKVEFIKFILLGTLLAVLLYYIVWLGNRVDFVLGS